MADTIKNMFMNALVTHLRLKLDTEIADDTAVASEHITAGRFLDDPLPPVGEVIEVQSNTPEWRDEIDTETSPMGYLVGGAMYWKRRFIVMLKFYDETSTEEHARERALTIYARLTQAIKDFSFAGKDAFAEASYEKPYIEDAMIINSGGDGTWIWRGEVRMTLRTCQN